MLSALVLDRTGGSTGPEFFVLARTLGRYAGEDERADRKFLEAEINSVWNQWGTRAPVFGAVPIRSAE
jgi:hypothetical protein